MAEPRRVTDRLSVSSQIAAADAPGIARDGFWLVINNRPDGEAPDQPAGSEIEGACRDAGLAYVHIPVRGAPTAEQAMAMRAALAEVEGPAIAFCRSGQRSMATWALGEALAGDRSRDELIALARAGGVDLSAFLASG